MKVIHVVSTFPPKTGGMGQVCFEEFKRLRDGRLEIEVLAPNHNGLRPLLKSPSGGFLPAIYNKIKDANLVHLHYPFYGGAEFVWLASKLRKQPYIVTYHMDAQASGVFGLIQKIYDLILSKKILRGAIKVITVDKDHLNNSEFGKYINKDKVVEIWNSVDLEMFKPIERKNNKIKTILFVGNLLAFKRFDLLLKAFAKLDNKNVNIKVIGGGFEESNLKKLAQELKIAGRVKFIGPITDRQELTQEYRDAYCTVVSSDCGESFSLVAVESLACGTPVVLSDIPGVRGRVFDNKTGFLFKSGSAAELSLKLKKILELNEEDYNKMSDDCRIEAESKYGWDKHIEKLIKVYNNA